MKKIIIIGMVAACGIGYSEEPRFGFTCGWSGLPENYPYFAVNVPGHSYALTNWTETKLPDGWTVWATVPSKFATVETGQIWVSCLHKVAPKSEGYRSDVEFDQIFRVESVGDGSYAKCTGSMWGPGGTYVSGVTYPLISMLTNSCRLVSQ